MPDEERRERGKKRVRLMGAARALLPEGTAGHEALGVSRDADAMELLALLVLGREFLPPQGVKEEDKAEGEVRRDWLAATLYPDLFGQEDGRRTARERVRYLLDKLHPRPDRTSGGNKRPPPLPIRVHLGERERAVARVTWKAVLVDVLALREAARQMHSADTQQEIIALGDRPLLEGMSYPWLQAPAFQRVRVELDLYFLTALARQADSLLVQRESANAAGRMADADACRTRALPLLDKAAERLRGYEGLRHRPEYAALLPWEAQFSALRRRAAYPLPDMGEVDAVPQPPAHNLPSPVTSFVGREHERQDIRNLLTSGRLVTLTGMGGCGKTRLAVQAARELLDGWDNVRLVELAALTAPDQVPQAVATALGVAEQKGVSVTDAVIAFLQGKRTLLLLDNCEHLLLDDRSESDDCGTFAALLLHACPALSVLATSREPLNIAGEHLYPVSPLPFPGPEFRPADASDPAALLGYEAARLFVDRALQRRPFPLGPDQARAVAAICAGLDGLPLFLELAAARVKTLEPEQIAEMLSDRFALLTRGRRESPARHKTLRAVIDWSYDLLDTSEQGLFCRLSVFAGGWTLDAAAAVGASEDLPRADVLNLLESVVDKSLVIADLTASPGRYRMLETVRQYAEDRLREQGEWEETRRRHRDYFLALAEEAHPLLKGPEQKMWLHRLEMEHDNLRAALASYRESGEQGEQWLRMAGYLWWFWWVRGYLNEGRSNLTEALSQARDVSPKARARALEGIGNLAQNQGDFAEGRAALEQSLELLRGLHDERQMASVLGSLGVLAHNVGDYEQAQDWHEEGLKIFRCLEDEYGIVISLINLGNVAYEKRGFGQAKQLFRECLDLSRKRKDERHAAHALFSLASVARENGDFIEAARLFEESLTLYRQGKDQIMVVHVLEEIAALEAARGQPVRAAQIWGATEVLRVRLHIPLTPSAQPDYDEQVQRAQSGLSRGEFAAAWAVGRVMTWEQAVALALGENAP